MDERKIELRKYIITCVFFYVLENYDLFLCISMVDGTSIVTYCKNYNKRSLTRIRKLLNQ